jgi:hypothetical protein
VVAKTPDFLELAGSVAVPRGKRGTPSRWTASRRSTTRCSCAPLAIYELARLDFAEAYLVSLDETTGVGEIVSFDCSIDRIATVERREPRPATRPWRSSPRWSRAC